MVIGTHGSSAAPVACQATTTVQQTSTPLPEVTSSDIANDLRIRIYGVHTNSRRHARRPRRRLGQHDRRAVHALRDDLHRRRRLDPGDGALADRDRGRRRAPEQRELADGVQRARYLKVTFPAYLPATATVTSAQLVHTFRPATASATACFYLDVLQGTTVLATYGSATTPYCATGAAYTTTTIALPVLNTAARVNGAIIRMYVRTTNARRTQHDQFRLDVGYAVD